MAKKEKSIESVQDAEAAMARLAELDCQITDLETSLKRDITSLQKTAAEQASSLEGEHASTLKALKAFGKKHRGELSKEDSKTIELTTGRIFWRDMPAAVNIPEEDEVIVERLEKLGLEHFVRYTAEPNKQAMLAEPDVAREVPGIEIESSGEKCYVQPTKVTVAINKGRKLQLPLKEKKEGKNNKK